MKLIAQGAEARLYRKKGILVKERVPKAYRIPLIDEKLRRSRTRREAKVLQKLEQLGFPAPRLIRTDQKERIEMEFLSGKKLSSVLENISYRKACKEIGRKIRILHDHEIIHGDLTTSNFMQCDAAKKCLNEGGFNDLNKKKAHESKKTARNTNAGEPRGGIFFVDFGLSFFSHKIEDKAVDLHLLRQALEAKHPAIWSACFAEVLKGYDDARVEQRLAVVERRGRHKSLD